MSKNGEKIRCAKYDNIKTFLMFCVIWGHIIYPLISRSAFALFLFYFIYSFHMAGFVYFIGKFSVRSCKRVAKFALLYLSFQTIYSFALPLIGNSTFTLDYATPQYTLWFLLVTTYYMIFNFVLPSRLDPKIAKIVVVIAVCLAVAVGFCPAIGGKFALSRSIVYFPFFLAGKYNVVPERSLSFAGKWGLAIFTITATSIIVLKGSLSPSAVYMNSSYVAANSSPLTRIAIIAVAFCWIKFLLSCIPDKKLPAITNIGKHTLFIYLSHALIVKIIFRFLYERLTFASVVGLSVAVLVACWGFSLLPDVIARLKSVGSAKDVLHK